ncbi:MAG TPA: aminotransferase class V-fold PLP-dependent enzyme [Chitinophaga sp.]|uniref:pyridoxal phosphate-dependent decarboxylase family protein n=1 Tax=Chitinophaga sp. TaxID=1869181 RepID=UPI002C3F5A92|nr:aminotransferase class V-fold PLP-dependent enzyme [Chitinophaga sp.]HVI44167.1 aminotransferase class V-fold PLP-dependent enzyme [Chitinophaga sp.]
MEKITALEKAGMQLEPGMSERTTLAEKVNTYINQFVEELPQKPGYTKKNIGRLRALKLREEGGQLDELLDILGEEMDNDGINSASGRHMGYIPGGGLWTSALADMLAAATNRYAGIAFSSPAAVEIENQMIRWLCEVAGYPATAHGNLTSGGSIANLVAIQTVRDHYHIHSGNVKKAVIYYSEQAHHCIYKALHMTGLHEAVIRTIGLNDRFQLDVHALQLQMEADVEAGLQPLLVVGTAGTTHTGAVDPLEEIAALCKQYHAWFHVDAAYGGFFLLVNDMKDKLKGIALSDSVVMDPHKTLFTPYGSGVVLIKNRKALLATYSHTAAYMQDASGLEDIDPADAGPELSRHFRGLRMWLPLHLHGIAPFRANLEEKILLCRHFHEQIGAMGFETGPAPDLSVAIFRCPDDPGNQQTEQLIQALHEDGRVFFSTTLINRKLWIRCAVVSFRTHLREIKLALSMVKEAMEAIQLGVKKYSETFSG